MDKKTMISKIDLDNYKKIRMNVGKFLKSCSAKYDRPGALVLDIAPQIHEGAKPYFLRSSIETLDIDPAASSTYTADLCKDNSKIIPDNYFNVVICTEVLEHTRNPFSAAEEIYRILKPGGVALVTTPYNFRIHGPLPDCWRFTEYGLRELFRAFRIVNLSELKTRGRDLMPIQYTLIAKKEA